MNSAPRSITDPLSSQTLLALTEAMEHCFDAAAWARLGADLGMPQLVDPELRLQKSLRFGDDDYGYCVAQFVRHLEAERPVDLRALAHRPDISTWLDSHAPGAMEELGSGQTPVTAPRGPALASEAVEQALAEVHHARDARGSVGSIHRVHDAFHRYLLDACARADPTVADNATVAQLYWSLTNSDPVFSASGQRSPQVGHVLASLASAVTALNTLPDDVPTAHADPAAPNEAEARLMADLVRTLFNYVKGRL